MGTDDADMIRSHDFDKTFYVHVRKNCGHQTLTVGRLKDTSLVQFDLKED